MTYGINLWADRAKIGKSERQKIKIDLLAPGVSIVALIIVTIYVTWIAVVTLKKTTTGNASDDDTGHVNPTVMWAFATVNLFLDFGNIAMFFIKKSTSDTGCGYFLDCSCSGGSGSDGVWLYGCHCASLSASPSPFSWHRCVFSSGSTPCLPACIRDTRHLDRATGHLTRSAWCCRRSEHDVGSCPRGRRHPALRRRAGVCLSCDAWSRCAALPSTCRAHGLWFSACSQQPLWHSSLCRLLEVLQQQGSRAAQKWMRPVLLLCRYVLPYSIRKCPVLLVYWNVYPYYFASVRCLYCAGMYSQVRGAIVMPACTPV